MKLADIPNLSTDHHNNLIKREILRKYVDYNDHMYEHSHHPNLHEKVVTLSRNNGIHIKVVRTRGSIFITLTL